MIETEINYKLLKKWLRQGDIMLLAEKHGISRSAAYKILNGKTKNFEFLQAVYQTAIERAQIFKTSNEKLQSL
jgi:predicted transcriptional regulator